MREAVSALLDKLDLNLLEAECDMIDFMCLRRSFVLVCIGSANQQMGTEVNASAMQIEKHTTHRILTAHEYTLH